MQPSISVNKLGEFIYGSEAKKKSILRTIKYPSTFINARYTTPKNAVIHFMVDEKHDLTILQSTKNRIDQRKADTEWQQNNKQCCLKAMDDLIICANTILAPYLKFRAQHGLPKVFSNKNIDGVSVHLNPDIVLLASDGKTVIGAIRLVFSKSRAIDISEGQIIAGLIKNHIENLFGIHLKESNCIALDVFRKNCIPATKAFKPLEAKIKKACNEIIQLWPNINK
jgi:hypothetical protein